MQLQHRKDGMKIAQALSLLIGVCLLTNQIVAREMPQRCFFPLGDLRLVRWRGSAKCCESRWGISQPKCSFLAMNFWSYRRAT